MHFTPSFSFQYLCLNTCDYKSHRMNIKFMLNERKNEVEYLFLSSAFYSSTHIVGRNIFSFFTALEQYDCSGRGSNDKY